MTCTHLRLLSAVSGDPRVAEDASMELVSVLQVRQLNQREEALEIAKDSAAC